MQTEPYIDPINEVLKLTFEKGTKQQIIQNYFSHVGDIKKWLCFSDYSLDDLKPNKVLTFTLVPHLINLEELSAEIGKLQPRDIKSTRSINPAFVAFIRSYPIINFSFILKDHRFLMTENYNDLKIILNNTFTLLSENIKSRHTKKSSDDIYNDSIDKEISQILRSVTQNKKVHLIKDMILIANLGAFVTAFIADHTKADLMGWFPDRDATNEIGDSFVSHLFNVFFQSRLSHKCEFAYTKANSESDDFFSEFIRIPDYIAGTLADYNFNDTKISKDKFNIMLEGFFASNEQNNFVFNLQFMKDGTVNCGKMTFHLK